MATSRLRVNFERLLNVCEELASVEEDDRWRLKKYVEDLQDKLSRIQKETCNQAAPILLKDFQRRVDLLKGVLQAETLEEPAQRMQATHSVPVPKIDIQSADERSSKSKQILLHTKAKFSAESRRALLGDKDGLRRRGGDAPESDLDSVLDHHKQMQERLADEMVELARNMKDHAQAASNIVKEDNKKLTEANRTAESNYEQLKMESARLEEQNNKSNWWMALLFLFIILVFIFMVLFMRLFPKPRT